MLQFFGRGSAFADQHNAAFFREQGDLILLFVSIHAPA